MLHLNFKPFFVLALILSFAGHMPAIYGQTSVKGDSIPLLDLSSFQNAGKNWHIVGDVTADFKKENKLKTEEGVGVLVNLPNKRNNTDLLLTEQHGDIDLELDFMLAKDANSGIYLQGLYEVQLKDSWNVQQPTASDNGGIYERWDDSLPAGQKGYQGYPPRQNASRAPGIWQHLKISFQAPRFDESGKKVQNAVMLLVELNGVIIHEDVELHGPTRGALSNHEKATGPLRLQGDHGAVAFKNFKMVSYSNTPPELIDLKYHLYKGKIEHEPDYADLPPEATGPSSILTSNVSQVDNDFLIRYKGTLVVKEPGEYQFETGALGGYILIRINNKIVQPFTGWRGSATTTLPAGELPFELLYSKVVNYVEPGLTVKISGPGIREFLLTDIDHSVQEAVNPILVDAVEMKMLRSFMDLPSGKRLVHTISVGSPEQVHYTYDLDKGALVQLWRGNFINATSMWYQRGDGSASPAGSVLHLGDPVLPLVKNNSDITSWPTDTVGSSYTPEGYVINKSGTPVFNYRIYGVSVTDAIEVLNGGKGIHRKITIDNNTDTYFARIAEGTDIEAVSKNMYLVDGKSYYLRLDDTSGSRPEIKTSEGRKALIIPVQGSLSYSILF